ncbi:MAG: pyrimidine-nucleoside phosphorylase [Acholeplasmataceae bacterium]
MNIIDIITKKRDGLTLSDQEIQYMVKNYTNGQIKDYQMSALLMAIYLKGMNDHEATSLALAMRDSGDVIDLSMIKGVKVDKHSTGGVGDKVTLVLGPLLAYFGVKFAKMSGRGLGHTGGTIDKLESIPGFRVELLPNEFIQQVEEIDIAVVGQSGDIAPADKKLYALRDVTATIDSVALIASSIMSKKLASGADAIVLDVKVGRGAFMKTVEEATHLAQVMVNIGRLAGKKMTAILTGMDEPLGHKIGNALEVYEAMETLRGNGPQDLVDVCVEIGAHLLLDAKKETDFAIAKTRLSEVLNNGLAYDIWLRLIKRQGGDLKSIENFESQISPNKVDILANKEGYITDMNTLEIGKAAMLLGSGRQTKEDPILFDVGLHLHKKIGDFVKRNEPLVTMYVQDKGVSEAKEILNNAFTIGQEQRRLKLILKTIK